MRARHPAISAAAATTALIMTLASLTAPSAQASVTVWKAVRMCAPATATRMSCHGMRLVPRQVAVTRYSSARARAAVASGAAGGYSPGQLAKAYHVNPWSTAARGITVGIVDAYNSPSVQSDLNKFDAHYGLPAENATSFRIVNQRGATSLPKADPGWAGEITLDVEAVRGLCHRCRIVLVEADSDSPGNLAKATDQAVTQGASLVSMSFGGPENRSNATLAAAYNHPKVAMIAATGDDGYHRWDNINARQAVSNKSEVPASYKTVIGVGGTSLYLNSDGTRSTEQVWNSNGPSDFDGNSTFGFGSALGAAGSGCSTRNAAQPWQRSVAGYRSLGCASGMRSEVDIAMVADPFTGYDIYEKYPYRSGAWGTAGGTSLAAPLIAAMWATAGGPGGVRYPAKSLYQHFKRTPHSVFDISTGGTGFCSTSTPTYCKHVWGRNPNTRRAGARIDCGFPAYGVNAAPLANRYQCYARKGYDGPTGVGVPNGAAVFKPMT